MDAYTGLNIADQDSLVQCLKKEAECRDLWIRAMRFSPQLAAHCRRWNEFTTMEWVKIITDNNQFADIAPLYKFTDTDWYFLLEKQPHLAERCPIIKEIPEMYWSDLLQKHPQLKKYKAANSAERQQ